MDDKSKIFHQFALDDNHQITYENQSTLLSTYLTLRLTSRIKNQLRNEKKCLILQKTQ